jgi:NitT/TauT family transport system permease protein
MSRVGWYRLLVVAAAIAVLEALCLTGVIDKITMQPPHLIVRDLYRMLVSGRMNAAITKTLGNTLLSLVLALGVGIIVGALLHRLRALRDTLDPLFATYYAVPVFAFYPFFIVVFGLGDLPQVLIGFMLGVVAVIVNTLNGLDRVPIVLLKTARIMRLSPVDTALRVTLPSAAPYIVTGVKLAVTYAFIGVIGSGSSCRAAASAESTSRIQGARQRDDVSIDRTDPARVGRDQRGALGLGAAPALEAGDAMTDSRWRGPRNALVLIAALVAIWQGLYWWVGDVALASPLATLRYTARLVAGESFGMHLFDTMRAFAIAFALSVAIGLLVGFWLGFDRLSGDALEPMIVAVYAIPKLTLYPILLLAFGLGLSARSLSCYGVIRSSVHARRGAQHRPILIRPGTC